MKLIAQGAEAEVYQDNSVILKKRIKKNYRLSEIDEKLRRSRTKREAKILEKLPKEIPAPILIKADKYNLQIGLIKGKKVRDILGENIKICRVIGKQIATMHNADIIHGDLTTSNMIFSDKVYFIDFGLGFFSHKIEDKAVDLHLLKRALESKHYKIFDKAFKLVLEGYREKSNNYIEISERLAKVASRGRYKGR